MIQPPRLILARLPTPLQPLDRLSAELGGPRIWVKRDDLSDCAASGNKIRKLEFSLAQALAEGCDSVVTCGGLQSNHCRATAQLGARLGLGVELVLRGETGGTPDGNLFLDTLFGATIHAYPVRRYQAEQAELLASHMERLRRAGRRPFLIPTGASDGIGVWGYASAAEELLQDFAVAGIAPGHLVVATGSGGTQAGLSAGMHLHGAAARVTGMAVCESAAWFDAKVRADIGDWRNRYAVDIDLASVPVRTLDAYIGPGYARATPEVMKTIARVARTEGIVLDPVYTGKAFHGMLQELDAGRMREFADIVFVHTGGIFGLLAQREEFCSA